MKTIHYLPLLTLSLLVALPVSAQTVSPTVTTTIRDSVKQKVAEELAQIKQAVAKRGFIGQVTAKSEISLTLTTLQGQTRTINITPDSTVKLKSGKEGTPADIAVNDYILVMGDVDSQNVMTGKRLLIVGKPPAEERAVSLATITKISSSSVTLTTKKDETLTLKISSVTKYNDKLKVSDFKTDSRVVVVYNTTSDTVLRLHLLPTTASTTPSPTTTP